MVQNGTSSYSINSMLRVRHCGVSNTNPVGHDHLRVYDAWTLLLRSFTLTTRSRERIRLPISKQL